MVGGKQCSQLIEILSLQNLLKKPICPLSMWQNYMNSQSWKHCRLEATLFECVSYVRRKSSTSGTIYHQDTYHLSSKLIRLSWKLKVSKRRPKGFLLGKVKWILRTEKTEQNKQTSYLWSKLIFKIKYLKIYSNKNMFYNQNKNLQSIKLIFAF